MFLGVCCIANCKKQEAVLVHEGKGGCMHIVQGSNPVKAGYDSKQFLSPWLPIGVQLLTGVLALGILVAWGVSRVTLFSAFWGIWACALPAFLCVAGYRLTVYVAGDAGRAQALLGLILVLFWELVKLLLSVALLLLAPRLIAGLNWVAMLVAFIVVVKAYWLTFFIEWLRKPRLKQSVLKTSV